MPKKVLSVDTLAGIQRDGTVFDQNFYTDGAWVRFQRGRPRKIGGYRAITTLADGLSRGIFVATNDGINHVFNGYNDGLEVIHIDNNGIGAGLTDFAFGGPIVTLGNLVGGAGYVNAVYAAVALTGGTGSGAKATITVAGGVVTVVVVTTAGINYLVGDVLSATAASLGGAGAGFSIKVVTVTLGFTASDLNLWQFDATFDAQGSGKQLLLAHPGRNLAEIDQTTASPVLASRGDDIVLGPLQDINGSAPTGDIISVSGGVVVLHPYVFVYGDNGLIKNSVAGDPYNWNGADANENNVSATKIVKGLPVRGGSNSPSGLFWSLDSLIRVSYAPSTITVGGVASTFYWRYDTISSQSSILSSQSVIEYDGIYYWCGVDRFLLYNGTVKEIPNTFNQNYFFDNLNYTQRQKVWATKVPRFGEIWWFYPSGNSEECNNAVIFNVRENCWYDAGFSEGATRTAGYFSQVFKYPINAGVDLSVQAVIFASDITTTNASAVIEIAITNLIAIDQLVVAVGVPANTTVVLIAPGAPGYYNVTLSKVCTASAVVVASFEPIAGKIILWQHEIGTDEVVNQTSNAIKSFFETSDLGFVAGNPAQPAPVGDNFWVHIERVEPDFIMSGEMSLIVTGRPYAQADDAESTPYVFDGNTHKIDMREQRREIRLRFTSNTQGGNYQLGRLLLSATPGDVRGY